MSTKHYKYTSKISSTVYKKANRQYISTDLGKKPGLCPPEGRCRRREGLFIRRLYPVLHQSRVGPVFQLSLPEESGCSRRPWRTVPKKFRSNPLYLYELTCLSTCLFYYIRNFCFVYFVKMKRWMIFFSWMSIDLSTIYTMYANAKTPRQQIRC